MEFLFVALSPSVPLQLSGDHFPTLRVPSSSSSCATVTGFPSRPLGLVYKSVAFAATHREAYPGPPSHPYEEKPLSRSLFSRSCGPFHFQSGPTHSKSPLSTEAFRLRQAQRLPTHTQYTKHTPPPPSSYIHKPVLRAPSGCSFLHVSLGFSPTAQAIAAD